MIKTTDATQQPGEPNKKKLVSPTPETGANENTEGAAKSVAPVYTGAEVVGAVKRLQEDYYKAMAFGIDEAIGAYAGTSGPLHIHIGTGETTIYIGNERLIAFTAYPVIEAPIEHPIDEEVTQEDYYRSLLKGNSF
jgi:hypothetical protein